MSSRYFSHDSSYGEGRRLNNMRRHAASSAALSHEIDIAFEQVQADVDAGIPGPPGPSGILATSDWQVRDDFSGYHDAFINIAVAENVVGTMLPTAEGNWGVSGNGTIAIQASENNHPGVIRLATNGGTPGIRIHKGRAITDTVIQASNFIRWDWVIRINDSANVQVNVGLTNSGSSTATAFILTQFNTAVSANLTGFCGDATGSPHYTGQSFGQAPGTGWNKISAVLGAGSVDFLLNDVLKTTISTHVPSTNLLNPFAEIFSASGSRSVDLDLCQYRGSVSR